MFARRAAATSPVLGLLAVALVAHLWMFDHVGVAAPLAAWQRPGVLGPAHTVPGSLHPVCATGMETCVAPRPSERDDGTVAEAKVDVVAIRHVHQQQGHEICAAARGQPAPPHRSCLGPVVLRE